MRQLLVLLSFLLITNQVQAQGTKSGGSWYDEEETKGKSATNNASDDAAEGKRAKRKGKVEATSEKNAEADFAKEENKQESEKEESHEKRRKKADLAAVEEGFTLKTSESNSRQTLFLRSGSSCVSIDYAHSASAIISCELPLKLTYRRFECGSKTLVESGKSEALVRCKGRDQLQLSFRTKEDIVTANLNVVRKGAGRRGSIATYTVDKVTEKDRSFESLLPQPELFDIESPKPNDAPIEFRFSGFASLEYESSNKFGYDAGGNGTTAAQNFSAAADRPRRTTGTFFSDLNFGITKDRTSLDAIIELGEIYFGDSGSGGGQGARSNQVIKVRNVYLTHEINRQLKAKGGIITSITDPRSFIYNDHTASVHALYESDLINGAVWYGTAVKSRPAATTFEDDHYISLQANMNFLSGIKNTVYGVVREKANVSFAQDFGGGNYNTLTGVAKTYWAGGTFEYAGLDPLIAEFTFIGNWNKFRSNTGVENTMFAYLSDLKLGVNLSSLQLNVTLEGLATSGAKGAVDSSGNKILGKRASFSSPVAAAYLMTIATNDGLDDAAGTPKQSTIANLGQDEGV